MSDWINKIVKIEKIEKHIGTDNLSIAYVLGDTPVVIKTGQYEIGQLVGYLSIESIVPDTDQFFFLSPKQYERYEENGETKQRQIGSKYQVGSVPEKYRRLKAKLFFGAYSMGMLIDCPEGMIEGDDLVEFLGLKKFEENEEENIVFKKSRGSNQASPPKGWSIPYYDLQSLRKFPNSFIEGEEVIILEKLHGANFGCCHDGEKLWNKSRRFYKKFDEDDMWVDAAIRYNLEEKLSKIPNIVLFSEIFGLVKGYRYDTQIVDGILSPNIAFFEAYDTNTMRYLDYDSFIEILTKLDLPQAPLLYRGPFLDKESMYAFAEGQSTLNDKHLREGFVIQPAKYRFDPKLQSRLKLKLVGKGYSLNKK